jgi:hypothetical protein
MGTLGGSPSPPAMSSGGQSPPAPDAISYGASYGPMSGVPL